MDIFSQKRFAFWAILILLTVNILTLTVIWSGKSRRPFPKHQSPEKHSNRMLSFLKEELRLSERQLAAYKNLREEHLEQSRILMDRLYELKEKEMMRLLFQTAPDASSVGNLAVRIGDVHERLELLTFNHFLDLKALCGEDQQEKLMTLFHDFFRMNRPPMPPGRNSPDGSAPPDRPHPDRPFPGRPPPDGLRPGHRHPERPADDGTTPNLRPQNRTVPDHPSGSSGVEGADKK